MMVVGSLDPSVFRGVAIVAVLVLLYGSRLTKGVAKQTAEGTVFPMKPVVAWARAIVLPLYILFFVYILRAQGRAVPGWAVMLFVPAVVLLVYQMPGTIVLTPMAVMQKFWLRKPKVIEYREVMAVQAMPGGRTVRVLGDNRVVITHTTNHSAREEFVREMEQRTGKKTG